MLNADQEFREVANRAACAYANRPAYVSYQTSVHVDVPALHRSKDVNREVYVRTADDTAVLQDLPKGRRARGRSFPLVPTFDAISYFKLYGHAGPHATLESYVTDVVPLVYEKPQSTADVVVTSLRYYHAAYAPDSSFEPKGQMHIRMTPLRTLTENHTGDLYLSDVYINNADPQRLPSRVRYISPPPENGQFTVDYRRDAGNWVVDHVYYEQSIAIPILRFAHYRVNVDARFGAFAFSAQPPIPELQLPAPSPSPVPSVCTTS